MINKLIEWSLKNRFLVACGTLLLIGWGIRSIYLSPVDAIPDLSENQVIVFADWPGRSPQEVEDQVTYPLSVNLQGLAGIKSIRATSEFGFSMVNIIFEEEIDFYFSRQRVFERLRGRLYLGLRRQTTVVLTLVLQQRAPTEDQRRQGPLARLQRAVRQHPVDGVPGPI